MIRSRTEGALGWPQGSSKLAALFCGQPLANGELLSSSMASCHQPHGVNGEEVGAGCWPDSRMQPVLAENQGGGGNTVVYERNNASSKTYNSQVKKKKKRFFNQTVLLSLDSEWEIVHRAKLAAEARPVKTICRQLSSK